MGSGDEHRSALGLVAARSSQAILVGAACGKRRAQTVCRVRHPVGCTE